MNIPWAEYWDFLSCSVDVRQPEGLQKLEDHLLHVESSMVSMVCVVCIILLLYYCSALNNIC